MKTYTIQLNCGTDAGYHRHYRRDEQPCERCREAHNESARKRRRERPRLHGRGKVVVIDAHLFTGMYLDTTPTRQIEIEAALGRDNVDRLVAQFDRVIAKREAA
ncbi:hypothetical protein D5S18_28330 [Nocardia panacis]|uniref:Uncharacterized protein n=1 Tax=Nocardia panacis TaxID=2340916 RepID=A0A3A4K5S7_9NOCA|nr:hypothetical protein [Nocardia panacis]RJO69810.1 hypothetical protein D5S18_28330 [Nocardia panacis]